MIVTIKDVAKRAGMSVGAVSMALRSRSKDDCNLSEKTVQKIKRVAGSMGYKPNLLASGLRSSRTHTVGVLVAGIRGDFYERILAGLHESLSEEYTTLLGIHGYDSRRELRELEAFVSRHVDGVVAAFSGDPKNAALYSQLSEKHDIPLVLVDRGIPNLRLPVVRSDHYGQTFEAVKTLHNLGHSNILYATGESLLECTGLRKKGYATAMQQIGGTSGIFHLDEPLQTLLQGHSKKVRDAARQIVDFHREEAPETTAVIAHDRLAYEILGDCRDRGIDVPDNLSVLGLDNCYPSALAGIDLSSVGQNLEEIGRRAGELLLSLMREKSGISPLTEIPVQVVLRRTTKKIGDVVAQVG